MTPKWIALSEPCVFLLARGHREAWRNGDLKPFAATNPDRIKQPISQRRCSFNTHRDGNPMKVFNDLYNAATRNGCLIFENEGSLDSFILEMMERAGATGTYARRGLYMMKNEHILVRGSNAS
jgi:hypothetical protein